MWVWFCAADWVLLPWPGRNRCLYLIITPHGCMIRGSPPHTVAAVPASQSVCAVTRWPYKYKMCKNDKWLKINEFIPVGIWYCNLVASQGLKYTIKQPDDIIGWANRFREMDWRKRTRKHRHTGDTKKVICESHVSLSTWEMELSSVLSSPPNDVTPAAAVWWWCHR